MEVEVAPVNSNVSFGEFLKQYKEITDWLKTIQTALQQTATTTLALSMKYLNRVSFVAMTTVFFSDISDVLIKYNNDRIWVLFYIKALRER